MATNPESGLAAHFPDSTATCEAGNSITQLNSRKFSIYTAVHSESAPCYGLGTADHDGKETEETNGAVLYYSLPPKAFQRKSRWKGWYDCASSGTVAFTDSPRRRVLKHLGISLFIFGIIANSTTFSYIAPLTNYAFVVSSPREAYIFDNASASYTFPIPICSSGQVINKPSWSFTTIDLPVTGSISFASAKSIDLAWNWLAGRGTQTFLVYLAYRVFTDALLKITETTHLSGELITSLSLFPTSVSTVWCIMKGLSQTPGWRPRITLVWLLISAIYLAIFPSLLDVITGYETVYETVFTLPSNSTSMNAAELQTIFTNYDENYYQYQRPANTSLFWQPLSNTTIPHIHWYDSFLDASWSQAFPQFGSTSWSEDYHSDTFAISNPDYYSCIVHNNTYQWGFSAEWVQIIVPITSAWFLGMWILWVDADHNSEFCRKGRRLGLYRGIVDIAEAIHEQLGDQLCAYTETELTTAVRKMRPLKYYTTEVEDGEGNVPHIGLSSRETAKVKLMWGTKYGKKVH